MKRSCGTVATSADYSEAVPSDDADDGASAGVDPGSGLSAGADETPALSFIALDAAGERLDRFLARSMRDISRTRIQRWIDLGAVWCDTRPVSAKTRLLGSETLFVRPLPLEADHAFEPDPVAFTLIAESAHWLVIDKPAGLVVHPAPGNWRGTLLNGLLHRWPAQAELPRAGIVHRLDKDTSGLLVVARTESARHSFTEQLRDRSMGRRYLAFVRGIPPAAGTVDAPIGRDPAMRLRMAVVVGPAGKAAITDYRVLASGAWQGQPVALIACDLRSGRTHQIRVHLASIRHPLLGDGLYGGPDWGIARQALHAWRLGFVDPQDRALKRWHAQVPEDLRVLARACGIDLEAATNSPQALQ